MSEPAARVWLGRAAWLALAGLLVASAVSFLTSAERRPELAVPWVQLAFAALAVAVVAAPASAAGLDRWLERHGRAVALTTSGLMLLLFVAWKLRQHAAFETTALDLSLYHSVVRALVDGRGFDAPVLGRHFFTEHFSPALALWAPPYWLWPDVRALLVVHAVTLWVAALPLAAAARRLGASGLETLLVALGCWLNPFTWRTLQFDVHPEAMLLPAGTFAVWGLVTRRPWAWWAAVLLMLAVKEDGGLLVAGLCVALWWAAREQRRHLLLAALLATAWTVVVAKVVLPAWQGTEVSKFVEHRYGSLGATYGAVAWRALTQPERWLHWLAGRPVRELLASVGLAPWATPAALVGVLPALLLQRLSDYGAQNQLTLYYGLPSVTILLVTVPFSLARLRRRSLTWALVGATSLAWPLVAWKPPLPLPRPTAEDREAHDVLAALPVEVRVAADNALHPHVSPRAALTLRPDAPEVDVIAVQGDLASFELSREELRAVLLQRLDEGWGVTTANETLVLLRRGAGSTPATAALRQRLGQP